MTLIPRFPRGLAVAVLALSLGAVAPAQATPAATPARTVVRHHAGVDVPLDGGVLALRLVRTNVLRVHFLPAGQGSPPALVMSPRAPRVAAAPVHVGRDGVDLVLASRDLQVRFDPASRRLSVIDAHSHRMLLRQADLASLAHGRINVDFAASAPLYGIHSFSAQGGPLYGTPDCSTVKHDTRGLLRRGHQVAKACPEGGAGAPLVWSTDGFGLLVDTKTAVFDLGHGTLSVDKTSRPDPDYYLIVGAPKAIFAAVADLSGHPQLFPKWAMGFTNSQWGIDEKELRAIVRTYRSKHIPIDNFTLDFDWKAWGQDHYGEFRWNGRKFPDGPSGSLATMMAAEGMHLTGIMKPRIHVDTVEGRYATRHHLWVPGEKASKDYFSHKLVKDIDFDKPAARRWFGDKAMAYGFDKGMAGWWNDEADEIDDNTQFLNMERSLYNAQRRQTDIRVWSINRSFWLGAQRYAYGLWSGDIQTGFKAMARQRLRMLNAINVGATLWGMDGGGFNGHPSDQNYARWIEFGAFTPIFRVHGTHNEKRQPWRYGAVAEKAAAHAIRLRYRLLPYIYAYAWRDHVDGVGLVRPLTFAWPHDPKLRNDVSAWMFGDWLLVSPVVRRDQTVKHVYLPAGTWTDYASGKVYAGGHTVTLAVDSRTWMDIPLFIRQGAILPTQPLMDHVGQRPVTTVTVDVFPAAHRTRFDYYDDDGDSYAYEQGDYFLQPLSAQRVDHGVQLRTAAPTGTYRPALKYYLFRVHGLAAATVHGAGPHRAGLAALEQASGEGWSTGHDRFGAVTYIRVDAARARRLQLLPGQH